jgi:hypothetical protein
MKSSMNVIVSVALASVMLGGNLALTSEANAAASKPAAGCAYKSGGKATDGTRVGDWKCEGKLWHKVPPRTHLPFFLDLLPMKAK